MDANTWFITGVSSGFGRELSKQLLEMGKTVIGTVRHEESAADLIREYPDTFDCQILDVTDPDCIRSVVEQAWGDHGRIDVLISNAGYGLWGCVEEYSESQLDHIVATDLVGAMKVIKAFVPHMRMQNAGRIIQISSFAGQVPCGGSSTYNATKFGIEGFCEALSKEIAPFGIGVTIVEPGGVRTNFRKNSVIAENILPEYEHCHNFLTFLPKVDEAAGDVVRMSTHIIESVSVEPAPARMVFGNGALNAIVKTLKSRLEDVESQRAMAASTDYVYGETRI